MRVEEINPMGPEPDSRRQTAEPKAPPVQPAVQSADPEDTYESDSGQPGPYGVAGYFQMSQGSKVVYALIDAAAAVDGRQRSPEEMPPRSGASDDVVPGKNS